jgi:hypothetical protein
MRGIALLVVYMLVLGTMTACTYPRDATELYGTYVAEYPFGKDRLTLKSNAEYLQEVTIAGKPGVATVTGQWWYDTATHYLHIENALVVADGFGNLRADYDRPSVGDTILPVERWLFRGLRIGGGEGIDYRKAS